MKKKNGKGTFLAEILSAVGRLRSRKVKHIINNATILNGKLFTITPLLREYAQSNKPDLN